jgi:hypothetical protein
MTIDSRPLDQRLNALDNATAQVDDVSKKLDPLASPADDVATQQPYTTQGDAIQADDSAIPNDSVFTGESVDVAGLKDVGKKILEKVIGGTVKDIEEKPGIIDKLSKPLVTPGKEVEQIKQFTVIPEAPKNKVKKVLEATEKIYTPAEPKNVASKIANDITEESQFLDYKNAVSDAYDLKSYDKMSYADAVADITSPKVFVKRDGLTVKEFKDQASADAWLGKQADKDGFNTVTEQVYDEKFLSRLMDKGVITEANPQDIAKLPYVMRDVSERNESILKKYFAAKEIDPNGVETKDLLVQFKIGLALEGNLTRAATGRIRDVSRSLGVLNEAYKKSATSPERAKLLQDIIDQAGGDKSIDDIGQHYLALSGRGERAAMAEKSLLGNVRDVWYSTWINGLLSSPVTHAKNIAGNALFGIWQVPEDMVAAAFGKVRTTITGSTDRITIDEVMAKSSAMSGALSDAFRLGAKAFKTNMPTDPATKLEYGKIGRDDFNLNFGDGEFGNALSNAVKYYGNVVTIPGRALMAEDEFFKAIAYRGELHGLAKRESKNMYNDLLAKNIDEKTAKQQSQNYFAELIDNPTDEIHQAATQHARVMTFTSELEGTMQIINKGINTELLGFPIGKLFFPFVRTPTNIVKETLSRSPMALPFALRTAIQEGGIVADKALAKVTLGSAAMYTMYQYTLGGQTTGGGPFNYKDSEALKATGWQAFSFVFNKADVNPALLRRFQDITNVTVGPDKIYVSYEALGPVASLLGMASTSAEYAMMNPDEEGLDTLSIQGAAGVYQYMKDLPMLQGISDIHDVFTSPSKNLAEKVYGLLSNATAKGADFLVNGSPVGAYSGMRATMERYMNPEKTNTMREEMTVKGESKGFNESGSAVHDGFFKALADIKARNPMMNDKMPPALDPLTGDIKSAGKGNFYETFSPFKRSDGKFVEGYATLIEYGVPAFIPAKTKDGVKLSAEQYNRWIELATDSGNLEERVVKLGKLYNKVKGVDLADAQTAISKEISDSYGEAWLQLLDEDPDLQMGVEEFKERKQQQGKY